jgi:hypothetical protein
MAVQPAQTADQRTTRRSIEELLGKARTHAVVEVRRSARNCTPPARGASRLAAVVAPFRHARRLPAVSALLAADCLRTTTAACSALHDGMTHANAGASRWHDDATTRRHDAKARRLEGHEDTERAAAVGGRPLHLALVFRVLRVLRVLRAFVMNSRRPVEL